MSPSFFPLRSSASSAVNAFSPPLLPGGRRRLRPVHLLEVLQDKTLRGLDGPRNIPPLHIPFFHLIADAADLQAVDAIAQAGQRNGGPFHVFADGPELPC